MIVSARRRPRHARGSAWAGTVCRATAVTSAMRPGIASVGDRQQEGEIARKAVTSQLTSAGFDGSGVPGSSSYESGVLEHQSSPPASLSIHAAPLPGARGVVCDTVRAGARERPSENDRGKFGQHNGCFGRRMRKTTSADAKRTHAAEAALPRNRMQSGWRLGVRCVVGFDKETGGGGAPDIARNFVRMSGSEWALEEVGIACVQQPSALRPPSRLPLLLLPTLDAPSRPQNSSSRPPPSERVSPHGRLVFTPSF